jgi:hypothetical protein
MSVNELLAIIGTLKLVIAGLSAVLLLSFIYMAILRSRTTSLKEELRQLSEDNRELIKRLEIISHGKVIN